MREKGDQQQKEFKELYDRFFRKVFVFAHKHTRDNDEAQDLAQEVFLKFWLNRESFSELIPADAQLLTIARQLVINRYKRELVRQKVYKSWHENKLEFSSSDNSDQLLLTTELTTRFESALDNLPPKRREIFEKSRFEGLSYEQIAQQLSISRSTVESQMVKALRSLRTSLLFFAFIFLS